MSSKPSSETQQDAGAESSTESDAGPADAAPGEGDGGASAAGAPELAKPEAAESYDDSLEAILLQAGARPPEPTAAKALGSKTLMGIGLEGLNLAASRAPAEAKADSPAEAAGGVDTNKATERNSDGVDVDVRLPPGLPSDDKQVSSLLDEVAEALNVQASEYRDRARGRLPGMPAPAQPPFPARLDAGGTEPEFEDPDDVDTALTPGGIPVVDDSHEPADINLGGTPEVHNEDEDEAAVLSPAGLPGSGKTRDGRSLSIPPPPGLSLGASIPPLGPPPGVPVRAQTPSSGLSPTGAGRLRLPTPLPGSPNRTLPPPPSGRLTLPIGTMAPALTPSVVDLTATSPSTPISLEASRRISAGLAAATTSGSGRVSSRNNARVTEPVMRGQASALSVANLPVVLAAQVKIATLSLAGLIALTFAGGLFVGMLVWRGQGRTEAMTAARTSPAGTSAPPVAPAHTAPVQAPTPAAAAPASPANPVVAEPAADSVVAPAAADSEGVKQPARRLQTAAVRIAPRPRRPTPGPATLTDETAGAAKPAALKPGARPSVAPASKPVATNATAKPVAKSKAKPAWHDPFAD
ncbi:MAG: hypothetical protein ABUS79_10770 [Pseudomonadota bacterium]